VADDIVTRLRHMAWNAPEGEPWVEALGDAADEIQRLRASLHIAAGKLSTLPPYTEWHPEVIYKALLEDGTQEVDRG